MSEETKRLDEPFAADDRPPRSEPRPSEPRPMEHDHAQSGRQVGYVAAIIANLVVLWAFHNLLRWGVPFLTKDWNAVLPFVDLSIWATMAANAMWLFYDGRWFRRLVQIGLNVLSFRVMWAMYRIFPFQFELYPMEQALKIAFLAAMLGLAIATAVETVSLLLGRNHD